MPLYHYRALTQPGEIVEGDLDAPDRAAVVDHLRKRGYLPLRAEEKATGGRTWLTRHVGRRRAISRQDEIAVYRELATLLSAGLPIDQALDILITYATRRSIAELMTRVLTAVRDGATLSKAMAAQDRAFDRFGLGMVRAGEAGGTLDKALDRTAAYLENSERARQNLRSALIYPAILLVSAGVSIVVIIGVVVPSFATIFDQAGVELPLVTRIIIWLGDMAAAYWWIPVVGVLLAILALMHTRRSEQGRRDVDARILRLPLLGPMITKGEIARLSYTLGMLISNGVPLVAALSVARTTLGNEALAALIASVEKEVKEGRKLADPLSRSRLFPQHATHLVRIGEESDNLESLLFKLSDMYDEKVQQDTKRFLTILTPALTLGMALLISGIIVSILVPMMSMYRLAF